MVVALCHLLSQNVRFLSFWGLGVDLEVRGGDFWGIGIGFEGSEILLFIDELQTQNKLPLVTNEGNLFTKLCL